MLNAESGCAEGSPHPESEDGHGGQRHWKAHPTRTAHGHHFPPGVRVKEPGDPILTPTLKPLGPRVLQEGEGLLLSWPHEAEASLAAQASLLGAERTSWLQKLRWSLG